MGNGLFGLRSSPNRELSNRDLNKSVLYNLSYMTGAFLKRNIFNEGHRLLITNLSSTYSISPITLIIKH